MARHCFEPVRFHNVIGAAEPVLTISDGDTVVAATIDAWGFDRHGKQVASAPNPMTGPFFIKGAEPGDALTVHIDRMTPSRDTGWTFSPLALNVIDPAAAAKMPERERWTWIIERQGKTARLAEPPPSLSD
jgi:amidase